jgi:hypothetical protein
MAIGGKRDTASAVAGMAIGATERATRDELAMRVACRRMWAVTARACGGEGRGVVARRARNPGECMRSGERARGAPFARQHQRGRDDDDRTRKRCDEHAAKPCHVGRALGPRCAAAARRLDHRITAVTT